MTLVTHNWWVDILFGILAYLYIFKIVIFKLKLCQLSHDVL